MQKWHTWPSWRRTDRGYPPYEKKIPGKSNDLPGKKQSYMCEKLSATADMPEDYGSLLVIFVREFSIAVRSAG